VVLACFATALAALLAGYLYLTIPGAWFSSASPKIYDAKALAIASNDEVACAQAA
jgi:hypothetical protein